MVSPLGRMTALEFSPHHEDDGLEQARMQLTRMWAELEEERTAAEAAAERARRAEQQAIDASTALEREKDERRKTTFELKETKDRLRSNFDKEAQALKSKLRSAEERASALEREKAAAVRETERLNHDLVRAREDAKQASLRFSDEETKLNAKVRALRAQLDDAQAGERVAKKQIADLESEFKRESERLGRQVREARTENETLLETLAERGRAVARLTQTADQTALELDDTRARLAQSQADFAAERARKEALELEMEKNTRIARLANAQSLPTELIARRLKDADALEKTVRDLEAAMQQERDRVLQLQKQLGRKNGEAEQLSQALCQVSEARAVLEERWQSSEAERLTALEKVEQWKKRAKTIKAKRDSDARRELDTRKELDLLALRPFVETFCPHCSHTRKESELERRVERRVLDQLL